MYFFCAVPTNTPIEPKGLPAIPSAGPYYIASYQPNRRLILKRNPNYRGPRPHRLDELDLALDVGEAQAVKEVEAGQADYASFPPRSSLTESARLAARYGPASPLGRAGKQRYFVNPTLSVFYFALNTSRPLFASAAMRRAVNFAVDRRALVSASDFSAFATDQYLPPGMAGFRDARIYPLDGPDLARGRQLAGNTSRTAMLYTCDAPNCLKTAQVLVRDLAAIGISVEVQAFSGRAVLSKKVTTKGEPWDITVSGWQSDGYYDPFDFLNLLFDGNLAGTIGADLSRFDDPAYNRRLEAAEKLTGPARYQAYAELDADLTRDAAPFVAWGNGASQDFFSARMGCQVFGQAGMNLAALCIRGHAAR
jgi:peptide/nickel transport system substrate-binding protein